MGDKALTNPPKFLVKHDDCLNALQQFPSNSIDSIVTDPPYGLSFMNKKWDYDVPSVDIWKECLRVLKPGGHLLSFAGTRTQHRMAVRIEDAGFEIRDLIAWVYGSGFPKSHNLDGEHKGWGTALKPAFEPITIARKPFAGTVAANAIEHGTGAMNIDSCMVGTDDSLVRPAIDRQDNKVLGKGLGSGTQIEPGGRWPANLIHDGSDEVLALFPGNAKPKPARSGKRGGKGFGMFDDEKSAAAFGVWPADPGGSAARFFYCAKANSKDKGEANDHPTVKPTDLMRYLCRLITPKSGVILDPFCGSGSTGKAAVLEGFRFVGIEREAEYVAIAQARIAQAIDTKESE
jgi:site-specific DNA-methyltransferase (adenine-specific)